MRHTLFTSVFATALALGGCATQSAAVHHAPTLGGPSARVVEFPGSPGDGNPREVHRLLDEPALVLVTIALRGGTVLPDHQAAVPVTIMALEGSGTVVAGTDRLHIDASHAVVLAAGVSHSVEPDEGTDLVLLVHHMGRGEESHR